MSSISMDGKSGVDPRVSMFLVLVCIGFLLASALSIGVVAVLLLNGEGSEVSTVSQHSYSTTTISKKISSTTTTSSVHATTKISSTTEVERSPTTFIEYVDAPTTTLLTVVEDCNHTYHGPFRTCGAKNVAWFDQWSS